MPVGTEPEPQGLLGLPAALIGDVNGLRTQPVQASLRLAILQTRDDRPEARNKGAPLLCAPRTRRRRAKAPARWRRGGRAPAPWPEDYAAYLEWKAAKARGEKPLPPEDDELVYLPPTQDTPDKQVPGDSAGETDY